MNKCPRCGQDYAYDVAVCPRDGGPLVPKQKLPRNRLALASILLGSLVVVILCSLPCQRNPYFNMVTFTATAMCGVVLGICGIVCGHLARSRLKRPSKQQRGNGLAVSGLIAGYLGIAMFVVLLLVVPKAQANGMRLACASNLKQIGLAAHIWSEDNNGLLPHNFLEMTNELNNAMVLICPADPNHERPHARFFGDFAWIMRWNPTNISYDFLMPGLALSNLSNQVIVRCPVHGNELMGDVSVRMGNEKP